MKTFPLIVTVAVSLFCISGLHAQTTVTKHNANGRTTTTTYTSRHTAVERNRIANAPVAIGPRTDGVVPRAIRSGNPLQMINPLAPAEYGNGQDVTRHDVNDPSQRPQGIKLYAIEF